MQILNKTIKYATVIFCINLLAAMGRQCTINTYIVRCLMSLGDCRRAFKCSPDGTKSQRGNPQCFLATSFSTFELANLPLICDFTTQFKSSFALCKSNSHSHLWVAVIPNLHSAKGPFHAVATHWRATKATTTTRTTTMMTMSIRCRAKGKGKLSLNRRILRIILMNIHKRIFNAPPTQWISMTLQNPMKM